MSNATNHAIRSHRSEHRKRTYLAPKKTTPTRNKYATKNRAERRRLFRKARKWLEDRKKEGQK